MGESLKRFLQNLAWTKESRDLQIWACCSKLVKNSNFVYKVSARGNPVNNLNMHTEQLDTTYVKGTIMVFKRLTLL